MEKNYAKKQKGITLVALVVTIVGLLILAGVSLNLVLGENGIVVKSREARTENDYSTVFEMLQMKNGNYETEYAIGETDEDFISYLRKEQIIDDGNVIEVKKLVGKKLSTGNGDVEDIYIIGVNNIDNSYRLGYVGKGEIREIGIIGYEKGVKYEPSDSSIFEFDKVTGTISLKGAITSYYSNDTDVQQQIIVVPEEINGVTVKSIGRFGNRFVEKVILPNTITEIKESAFTNCSNLQIIEISEGIITIDDKAFYGCQSLKKASLPMSLKEISLNAFEGCSSLENITFPENVEKINLPDVGIDTIVNVSEKNKNYCSEDGVLFNKDKTELLVYPRTKQDTEYQVPAGVTKIRETAFCVCNNLVKVTIGENVKEIGNQAFFRCDKLEEVVLPNQLSVIGDEAFYACSKLRTAELPKSVTKIGDNAFWYCRLSTVTIPSGVQVIGQSAFENNLIRELTLEEGVQMIGPKAFYNNYLRTINIPSTVTYIDVSSFNENSRLREINVAEKNEYFSSEDGVLFNKDKTSLIRYPDDRLTSSYEIPSSVVKICKWAFYYSYGVLVINISSPNLSTLTIPNSVTTIEDMAFFNYGKLKVNVQAGTSLTSDSFKNSGISASQVNWK